MHYNIEKTGERIRKLRKDKGLMQEQLADELNISAVHIAKIETGRGGCSWDIFADIATFFDASLDYLVLEEVRDNELRRQLDATILALENLRQSL